LAHSETSTGVLNDLPRLTQLCRALNVKICVDCVSTLGTMPLDLSQVWLASSTSGKALGAPPGLALVFHNEPLAPAPDRLPRYLDLGLYHAAQGVPFTILTNLVYALKAALAHVSPDHLADTAVHSDELRRRLAAAGLNIVTPEDAASPAVTTVALPAWCNSVALGETLEQHGFLLYYRSRYLTARNWVQVCLMGDYRADALGDLVDTMAALVRRTEREGNEHSRRAGD
jgi:aspartate aminotransferase-like enzyme